VTFQVDVINLRKITCTIT